MSFDPIDNGWRKLLKNGGVGYTEKGKVYSLGGTTEGKETVDIFGTGQLFYKIPNELVDLNTIERITCDEGKGPWTVSVAELGGVAQIDFGVAVLQGVVGIVFTAFDDVPAIPNEGLPNGIPKGTYVVDVSVLLHSKETVHTIDQKYLFPRVELKTKMRTDDLFPYKFGHYPLATTDAVALEEARKSGIFYVSFRSADPDTNPWHLGGIATYAKYDDNSEYGTEIYAVSVHDESYTYRLLLYREVADTVDWFWELAVLDGNEILNTDDFPVPE